MPTNKPNTISFGPSQQDLQAEQIDLQRRQQFADALRAQSLAPLESQMVSGRVVKTSPWLGAIKLAQAALANSSQQQNASDEAALGKAAAARQAAALRALAPAGAFDQPQDFGQGINSENVGGQPQIGQADQATRTRWAQLLAANQYDPQLGRDLLKNELTQTDEQRNLQSQGIDSRSFGRARLAKEQAGGITNVAAGTSVFNPSTGQFVAAAPDFGNGIQGGFGQNGQPQVSRIAGAQVIPQIAGEKARAEAAGRAGFNTITVNTPNGPVLLTEEQAAKMAGGVPQNQTAPSNMGFPPGANVPAPMPDAQAARMAILQSELQQIMARPDTDQRKQGDFAAINREIAAAGGGQRMPGIPLMSKAQEAMQVGQAENAVALAKDLARNAQSPESQQKIADAQSVIGLLDEAAPFIDTATSSTAGNLRDSALGLVGRSTTAGQDAARLAAIGGQLTSKQPKMSGPQSDKDVLLYREMAGRIGDPTVPSETKRAAAETIRRLNIKYLQQNQGGMASQALDKTRGGGKPTSLDDLINKYGGR